LSQQQKRSTSTETAHKKMNATFTANTTRQTLHNNRNGAQDYFYHQTTPVETATVSCIMGGEGKT
jgi:hypothetical protein